MCAKQNPLEIPNAFIGKTAQPTPEKLRAALGTSAKAWAQLVDELATHYGVAVQEWKSYSLKSGWALRLLRKKRTIIYLSPCEGCFRIAIILGDTAIKSLREGQLSKRLADLIQNAPKYPEGTGVRLLVKGTKELAPIRKLVEAKLAH